MPVPIVRLYATEQEAETAAAKRRECASFGCKFEHSTVRVRQLSEDEKLRLLPDLGERERIEVRA